MKPRTKKLLSLLVTFAMLIGMMPMVYADETTSGDSSDDTDGNDHYAVAKIGETFYETLDEAIESAAEDSVITLLRDATLTSGVANEGSKSRNVTIMGATGSETVDVITNAVSAEGGMLNYQRGSDFVFSNVTVQAGEGSFDGIVCDSLTFDSCTIKGKLTLYGAAKFYNCTFENDMENQYSIWTWGGTNVKVDECTFNTNGKAILLYGRATAENPTNLVVTNCTFNDRNSGAAGKAAIEIGNDYNATYTLTVSNATVNGFAAGKNTDSTLWANKNSMDGDHLTVTVDGKVVFPQAADAVAEVNGTEYTSLQDAIDAANTGDTVTLVSDIDLSCTVAVTGTVTLDLNDKKIYNTADLWDVPDKESNNWSLISVRENGDLTITGNGTLQAKDEDCYPVDVQDGATLTIENGTYVGNIHAVYVEEGTAYINGGHYSVQQKYPDASKADEFVLNCYDANRVAGTAKIFVTGGSFEKFNPADCCAEGTGTNFVSLGYEVAVSGDVYTVSKTPAPTVSDGSAATTVSGKPALNETDVTVDATTNEDVKSSTVTVSNDTLTAIAESDSVETVTINTDVGTLAVSKEALSTMATGAGKNALDLRIAKTEGTDDSYKVKYTLTAQAGGENVFESSDGKVTISVRYTGTNPVVYYDNNGKLEEMESSFDGTTLTWSTNHFSDFVVQEATEITGVASVNGTGYESVTAAIEAATAGQTVTLLDDTKEDVVINKNITLDLGGKTLTNTNAGKATIQIADGVTATVKNGSVMGGTSYYNIAVGTETAPGGTLSLEDVTATAGNNASSMIDNWGVLTITSGTYTGGLDVVKSEPGATLTISDGDFTLTKGTKAGFTAVVFNYGDLTITGGTFTQSDKSAPYGQAQVIHTDKKGSVAPSSKIAGGTFKNLCTTSTAWTIRATNAAAGCTAVSGGTFNKKVSDSYCAAGYIPAANSDGTYGVKEGQYVAKIGSTGYETLADAIKAAKSGKTVTLLTDVTLPSGIQISKNIVLDLNQKTVTAEGSYAFSVSGEVTIQNGAIETAGDYSAVYAYGKLALKDVDITGLATEASLLNVNYNANVTIDKDSTITATSTASAPYPTVFIKGQDDNGTTYDPTLNIYGTVTAVRAPAIQGNGTDRGTSHINIYEGATVKTQKLAIYLPQPCEVNITGGTVSGYCGIGIKSGTLNISGGTVQGVANDNVIGDQHSQTNGISYDGSAIMIDSYIGYAGQVQVNISGTATVESKYSTAIREIGNSDSKTNLVALNVTGGTVIGGDTAANDILVRTVTAPTVAVSGGSFKHEVQSEYCAIGYEPKENEDGTYTVDLREGDAYYTDDKGNVQYGDLEKLLDEAGDSVVTLFKDTTVESDYTLKTGKTIDLGGKKLTLTDDLVSFGKIEDSQEGEGLIVTNGKKLVLSGDTGNQISVYDATNSGYRFFTVDEMFGARVVDNEGYVKIYCAPVFKDNENSGAWDLIKGHVDANSIRIRLSITLADGTSLEPTDVTFKDTYVKQLCENPDGALWIKIKSLDEITAEQVASVTATPIMVSDTNASQKGTGYSALTA